MVTLAQCPITIELAEALLTPSVDALLPSTTVLVEFVDAPKPMATAFVALVA